MNKRQCLNRRKYIFSMRKHALYHKNILSFNNAFISSIFYVHQSVLFINILFCSYWPSFELFLHLLPYKYPLKWKWYLFDVSFVQIYFFKLYISTQTKWRVLESWLLFSWCIHFQFIMKNHMDLLHQNIFSENVQFIFTISLIFLWNTSFWSNVEYHNQGIIDCRNSMNTSAYELTTLTTI